MKWKLKMKKFYEKNKRYVHFSLYVILFLWALVFIIWFIRHFIINRKYNVVYADNNGSTPIEESVKKEMMYVMNNLYSNPSSIHQKGLDARKVLEDDRKALAKMIHIDPRGIIFTSGASESNNTIIQALCAYHSDSGNNDNNGKKKNIVTTPIEHASISTPLNFVSDQYGIEIRFSDVKSNGLIDIDNFASLLDENTIMVCIIMGNNEIGSIQDMTHIGELCQKKGIHLHSDMTQIFGKYKVDIENMILDSCTLSAHKFYGPKGVGCLLFKDVTKTGSILGKYPLISGGSQENGYRGGTENLVGIHGLVYALQFCYNEIDKGMQGNVREMKKQIMHHLLSVDERIQVLSPLSDEEVLYNTLCISLPCNSRKAITYMNKDKVYVNVGCACSNGSASKVLLALNLPENVVNGSMRISLGFLNQKSDIRRIVDAIIKAIHEVEEEEEEEQKKGKGRETPAIGTCSL